MRTRCNNFTTTRQAFQKLIAHTHAGRCLSLAALAAVCSGLPGIASGFQMFSHETTVETHMSLAANGNWTTTGNLNTARDTHMATLLPKAWCSSQAV